MVVKRKGKTADDFVRHRGSRKERRQWRRAKERDKTETGLREI